MELNHKTIFVYNNNKQAIIPLSGIDYMNPLKSLGSIAYYNLIYFYHC